MQAIRSTVAFGELGLNSEAAPFGIQLQCPRCKSRMTASECGHCGFHLRDVNGILHALPPERVVHHARFVEEYEREQCVTSHGSKSDEFYLGLPYSDATRQDVALWSLRARCYDCILQRVLKPLAPAGGRILDLGAGNCWLSYRLALAGYSPFAVDLLTNDLYALGAAEHYRSYLPDFFPRFRAEFDHLPFKDAQFHAAIFNASFHYAENFESSLREALRCCKQRGVVVICDTPWFPSREAGDASRGGRPARVTSGLESASQFMPGFLTDSLLSILESQLQIRWTIHSYNRGLGAALRPLLARFRNLPEPPRFRVFVAQGS